MSQPAVNVNLRPCTCGYHVGHGDHCRGKPVLVPLPLEPWRTVTMKVVLGECDCDAAGVPAHAGWCSSTPIEVTCSIRGKTWADSEVVRVEARGWNAVGAPPMLVACRDRWALVKALVTGSDCAAFRASHSPIQWSAVEPLLAQRDVVYAAICNVARTEVANLGAQERLVSLLDPKRAMFWPTPEDRRPTAHGLAIYVERLIEQVGLL